MADSELRKAVGGDPVSWSPICFLHPDLHAKRAELADLHVLTLTLLVEIKTHQGEKQPIVPPIISVCYPGRLIRAL